MTSSPLENFLYNQNNKIIHPHDAASILNEKNIAIRSGHHCAQPLMDKLGVPATNRISFYIYNEKEDTNKLVESLEGVKKIFN